MKETPSRKAKIFCVLLVAAAAIAFTAAGIWQMGIYNDLTRKCTAQVTGTVVNESRHIRREFHPSAENKYLTGKYWCHIEVETDGVFKLTDIYANDESEQKGDIIPIFYDPDDPDVYYLGDRVDNYNTASVFAYGAGGVTLLLDLLLVRAVSDKSKKSR